MEFVLASRNAHKVREFGTILSGEGVDCRILSLDDIGCPGEIEEDGASFEENALIKAAVPALAGHIGLADDSGLAVDALDGAPGIYSARYAGGHGDDTANNEKLLSELRSVPDEKRTAGYVCAVALVLPKGSSIVLPAGLDASVLLPARLRGKVGGCLVVRGECRGTILREYHGTGGFGYDPLFYREDLKKTFAEVTAEEKNAISHRGAAVRKMAAILKSLPL